MKVLSLFDGVSCGRLALKRAGIPVSEYYASEIDKYAIQIAQKNYPDTIQLGDITNWQEWDIDYASIDLVTGGFPCQSWSVAGKGLGDKDERGKLFWVMLDIMQKVLNENPKAYFLMENVRMKKEFEEYITYHTEQSLGHVEKHLIDSALVSAQRRKRFYWTNIPEITQPGDKGIMLKDIVHEHSIVDRDKSYCIDANYYKGGNLKSYYEKRRRQLVFEDLEEYIVPFDKTLQILDKEIAQGKVGYFRKDSQANRVYYIHDKAITLCGEAGGGAAKMGQYLFGEVKKNYFQYDVSGKGHGSQDQRAYYLDGKHGTLPSQGGSSKCKVLFGCITPDRVNKRQNGQRFNDGKKFYTLTAQDRHGVLIEGYIRKLTPIECERLQTLPDGYTQYGLDGDKETTISNSQRYKAIGNGWTVDVIAHILKHIPKEEI